jgi:hypothetical protein
MSDQDRDYLARRRDMCLAKAEASAELSTAKVHRNFAAEYGRRFNAAQPEPLMVVAPG